MPLYSYKKHPVGAKKKFLSFVSYTSMTIGVLFLFWSFYPVLASEFYSRVIISKQFANPLATQQAIAMEKGGSIKGNNSKFSTNLVDYTKASTWFVSGDDAIKRAITARPDIKEYTISIPKVGVEDARVLVGGDDLLKAVVQYLPESLPGEPGSVNIFGHSSLLQLYNPTDYKHIFSYVPFMENGDMIYVTVDGVKYSYEVYDKVVVKPTEVSVLKQNFDNAYLNLITCVPHGTYLNRAVIKARLAQLPLQ